MPAVPPSAFDVRVVVTWQSFRQTFFHPLHPMGYFDVPHKKDFASREEADAFAEGLRASGMFKDIVVGTNHTSLRDQYFGGDE